MKMLMGMCLPRPRLCCGQQFVWSAGSTTVTPALTSMFISGLGLVGPGTAQERNAELLTRRALPLGQTPHTQSLQGMTDRHLRRLRDQTRAV